MRGKVTFSTEALLILNVQLCIYRAAFNFNVDLPMTEEALDETKYSQANNMLETLGLVFISKKEVLAKGFPPIVLTGDTRDWYSNGVLPRLALGYSSLWCGRISKPILFRIIIVIIALR